MDRDGEGLEPVAAISDAIRDELPYVIGKRHRLRRFLETLLDDGSSYTAPRPIEIGLVLQWDEESLVHAAGHGKSRRFNDGLGSDRTRAGPRVDSGAVDAIMRRPFFKRPV